MLIDLSHFNWKSSFDQQIFYPHDKSWGSRDDSVNGVNVVDTQNFSWNYGKLEVLTNFEMK